MHVRQRESLVQRLIAAQRPEGGWGYSDGGSICGETTSLACLALSAWGIHPARKVRGLDALARLQRPDGGVPSVADENAPCWPTALAGSAWLAAGGDGEERYRGAIARATQWLLDTHGEPLVHNETVYGHDTSLIGWSWVAGTHSWVEPTGYAVLALRAAGHANHARVREGVRLLLDRAIPSGGWNYGNKRVFGNTLRPFPETTGVALTALAGEPSGTETNAGLEFLAAALPRIRAPQSLAWGVMGMTAWGRCPAEASEWLTESAARCLENPPNPLYDALLLLAAADPCPLISTPVLQEASNG